MGAHHLNTRSDANLRSATLSMEHVTFYKYTYMIFIHEFKWELYERYHNKVSMTVDINQLRQFGRDRLGCLLRIYLSIKSTQICQKDEKKQENLKCHFYYLQVIVLIKHADNYYLFKFMTIIFSVLKFTYFSFYCNYIILRSHLL